MGAVEQAVIIRFRYAKTSLEPLHQLEEELESFFEENGIGEYDGYDIHSDWSEGTLYIYGYDAQDLFDKLRPFIRHFDFMHAAMATLRFGPPEDGVQEIQLEV